MPTLLISTDPVLRARARTIAARLPELRGRPLHLERIRGLQDTRGPVHAAAFLRERRIAFDCSAAEFPRIFVHELFHFVWLYGGNPLRWSFEDVIGAECRSHERGELGWSAQWRKDAIRRSRSPAPRTTLARVHLRELLRHGRLAVLRRPPASRVHTVGSVAVRPAGNGSNGSWSPAVCRYNENQENYLCLCRVCPPLSQPRSCSAICVAGCSTTPRSVNAASVKPNKDRKPAPDFTLKDADGKVVHLSDYKGKVVLLDFWATWCGPCKIEIPWFMEMQRKNKDKGFEVLGVAMDDEGWEVVKPFVAKMAVNYRMVIGNDTTAQAYGGVDALPTTFLIDRTGKIAAVHVGLTSKKDFEDGIEQLLQDTAPVTSGDASCARRCWRKVADTSKSESRQRSLANAARPCRRKSRSPWTRLSRQQQHAE